MGAKPTAETTPDIALQDEVPLDLIEISGVIKWFDVAKGYGFVVPDNGKSDVLLHVTCLRRDGFPMDLRGAGGTPREAGTSSSSKKCSSAPLAGSQRVCCTWRV